MLSTPQQLARYFEHPQAHRPQRLPTYPGTERTSVLAYNSPYTWTTAANTDYRLALYPQPTYPLWADVASVGTETAVVSFLCPIIASSAPAQTSGPMNLNSWTMGASAAPVGYITPVAGATSFSTAVPVVGFDSTVGDLPFVYVPPGAILGLYVSQLAPSGSNKGIAVEFETWVSPGEMSVQITIASDLLTIATGNVVSNMVTATNLSGNIWVRPKVITVNASDASVSEFVNMVVTMGTPTITQSTTLTASPVSIASRASQKMFVPVVSTTDMTATPYPWSDTRLVAASVTATNVTSVLNKGGTFTAARLVPTVDNPYSFAATDLVLKTTQEKLYGPAELGWHTFVAPAGTTPTFDDYIYSQCGSSNASATGMPMMNLGSFAYVNAMLVNTPQASTFACIVEWHIEFRNSRTLFPVDHNRVAMAIMSAASGILAGRPPFSLLGSNARIFGPTSTRYVAAPVRESQRRRRPKQQLLNQRRAQPAAGKGISLRKPAPPQARAPLAKPAPKLRSGLDMYQEKVGGKR